MRCKSNRQLGDRFQCSPTSSPVTSSLHSGPGWTPEGIPCGVNCVATARLRIGPDGEAGCQGDPLQPASLLVRPRRTRTGTDIVV